MSSGESMPNGKSEEEWRTVLSPAQVRIISYSSLALLDLIYDITYAVQDPPREGHGGRFQG